MGGIWPGTESQCQQYPAGPYSINDIWLEINVQRQVGGMKPYGRAPAHGAWEVPTQGASREGA